MLFLFIILGGKQQSQTLVIIQTATAISFLRPSTPLAILEKMETPELNNISLALTSTPASTDTPIPTNTLIPTDTPTLDNTSTPQIQKLKQDYKSTPVSSDYPKRNQERLLQHIQTFDAPLSTNDTWQTTKMILIDLGLWYPVQAVLGIFLIVIFVFVILSRLEKH